jgi:ABC-type glycerol-3-phosphate transport system substrate-binding protein
LLRRGREEHVEGSSPRGISRKDFLRTSGTGLAGAVLLGAAGCGGGGQSGGVTELYYSASPDDTGTPQKLIDTFNKQNKGTYKVTLSRATLTQVSAWTSSGPSSRLVGRI